MSRPQFTRPVERPTDSASRTEDFGTALGQGNTAAIGTETRISVQSGELDGAAAAFVPDDFYVVEMSANARGVTQGADFTWYGEVETDDGTDTKWIEYASGPSWTFTPQSPIRVNAANGYRALVGSINNTGATVTADASITWITR